MVPIYRLLLVLTLKPTIIALDALAKVTSLKINAVKDKTANAQYTTTACSLHVDGDI